MLSAVWFNHITFSGIGDSFNLKKITTRWSPEVKRWHEAKVKGSGFLTGYFGYQIKSLRTGGPVLGTHSLIPERGSRSVVSRRSDPGALTPILTTQIMCPPFLTVYSDNCMIKSLRAGMFLGPLPPPTCICSTLKYKTGNYSFSWQFVCPIHKFASSFGHSFGAQMQSLRFSHCCKNVWKKSSSPLIKKKVSPHVVYRKWIFCIAGKSASVHFSICFSPGWQ